MSSGLGWFRFLGRVDPDGSRDLGWFWGLADEPLRGAEERRVQGSLAGGVDCARLPEVDMVRFYQAHACVMMFLVMPSEDVAAECAGLFDRPGTFGELRLIFLDLSRFRSGQVI